MMTTLTVVLPLLPGKQEAWRQFCQTLQGSRHSDYAAWRERMGITQEEIWLSQTWQVDLVRIHRAPGASRTGSDGSDRLTSRF